ncbi:MAG: hypothetical protein ACFFA5_08040 [Promethearchaeota archaeon]
MSDEALRNKVKELSNKWKECRDYQFIHEALHTAKQIKEDKVQVFLAILHDIAEVCAEC